MKVAAEAERLRRAGHDVVDFSVGEPDFRHPSTSRRLRRTRWTRTSPATPRSRASPNSVRRSVRATRRTTA
jgi:aspartate/methionine/tyrosine aminotransferase